MLKPFSISRRQPAPAPAPPKPAATSLLEATVGEADARLAEARATLAALQARLSDDLTAPSAAELRDAGDEVAFAEQRRSTAVRRAQQRLAVDHAVRLAILHEVQVRRVQNHKRLVEFDQALRRLAAELNAAIQEDVTAEEGQIAELTAMLAETQLLDAAAGLRHPRFNRRTPPPEYAFRSASVGYGVRIADLTLARQTPLQLAGGYARFIPPPPRESRPAAPALWSCTDQDGRTHRSHHLSEKERLVGRGGIQKSMVCMNCGKDFGPANSAA